MIVYKISKSIAERLQGIEYTDGITFNPIEDINSNWFISEIQLKYWDKNLDLFDVEKLEPIEYEQKIVENPFTG